MTSSYEASFHKIASVTDLPMNESKAFRAAGATVVVRRTADQVLAEDLQTRSPLAVRVENGEVWVCIEACEP
jgi:hypothetical protein